MRVSPIYNWPASAVACSVAFPRALSGEGVSAYFFADYRIRNNAKDYVGWFTWQEGRPIGVIIRSVFQREIVEPPWETHLEMCTYTSALLKTLLCTGSLTRPSWPLCPMFPVYPSATYEHRFHSYLRHVTWSRRRPRSNDTCVVFAQSSSGSISLGPLPMNTRLHLPNGCIV